MCELGVIDVWREFNPTSKDFTYYSFPHSVYSRLDYFFMFSKDKFKVKDNGIATIDLSDHSPISITISLERSRKNTLWKLNSNILNDPVLVNKLKDSIKDYLDLNDTGEVSPTTLWDALKAVLRGEIISITAHLKKMKSQRLTDLQGKLKKLQLDDSHNNNNTSLKLEIKKTQKEIDEIYSLEIQKKYIFLKQKNYEVGAKSAKILAYKLRKQQADRTINKIKDTNTGKVEHSVEKIQGIFEKFYQTLYSQPQVPDDTEINSLLSSLDLPYLTNAQNDDLMKQISIKEIDTAISKLKTGKSPG